MGRLSVSWVAFIWIVAGAVAGDQNSNTITKTFKTNSGMFGVASIAGVTSRNGRVSSVSGVKFYPGPGSHEMAFFVPSFKSGDKLPEPISFSKEENGRITSGSIKYGPGSVSVSSSARSAFPTGSSTKQSKPLMVSSATSSDGFDDMFFQYPLAPLSPRSFDPWFPTDFTYRQPSQPRFNNLRPMWPYPSFSPFNYW